MKKKNTIAMSEVAKFAKKNDAELSITLGDGDERLTVVLKTMLTLQERREFIDNVIKMVFLPVEDGTVTYCPHMKEFAIDYNLVASFTNIKLGNDPEKVWALVQSTGIVKIMLEALPEQATKSLFVATDESIEYMKNLLLKRSRFDAVLDEINNLVKSVNDKVKNMDTKSLVDYLKTNFPDLAKEFETFFKDADLGAILGQNDATE